MRDISPLAGIVCDRRMLGEHAFHMAEENYLTALRDGAGATPFLIPALEPSLAIKEILPHLDGLLFTGSASNVAPKHYGGAKPRPKTLLDEARDATALPLLRAAIAAGIPTLCICRGFQELNVAFGGTLHQHLHEIDGYGDHRIGDRKRSLENQYAEIHDIRLARGGLLSRLLGREKKSLSWRVNSLHGQGIDRLAKLLRIEAKAPDGVIEAVSMPEAPGFLLGVQWHPEWRVCENRLSQAIFGGFGEALRAYARIRRNILS